ncbi:MAG: serine/threonine protein kinase [Acidobacteria bacterium]|nr:serine/threonine protein kinase [Acidobacteriota bacterium]
MALSSGTRLGPYEIQSAIGAGGMGEVYKARDTRLGRAVAVKVLPPGVAGDPERRARFEREAQTIAGLNHPHICTLHDVGEHDGSLFLVMEHLEGQTLAERLRTGPLPVDQALAVGAEIATALAAAHRQGIVHRDLKPANVMLTKAGAKLLDFGLARLTEEPAGVAASATRSSAGMVVGTAPYMAPEQVEGRPIDARTDLFAFGAVLYEMLTGRRAFAGESAASVMAAVLEHTPPPVSTLQPLAPPLLDQIVRSCLAKNPEDRCQCAVDAGRELAWVASHLDVPAGMRPGRPAWTSKALAVTALAGTIAGSLGFVATALLWKTDGGPVGITSPVRVGIHAALAGGVASSWALAISPDGKTLAYVCEQGGQRARICLRSRDAREGSPVPGTEEGSGAFFSPDGRWLAFFTDTALKKVRLPAGPADTLVSNVNYEGRGVWGKDDSIVFATDQEKAVLLRVPAAGGPTERVMEAASGEWYLWSPTILPDGRTVLVTASDGSCAGTRVVVQRLDGGPRRTLLEGAADARYLASGHVLLLRGSEVLVAPFDAASAAMVGPLSPLAEPVEVDRCQAMALSVSTEGTLAYLATPPAGVATKWSLVWVDRGGRELSTVIASEDSGGGLFSGFNGVRLSPDARTVALVDGDVSISVFDLDRRGVRTRLSQSGFWPIWSRDGRRVAFSRVDPGSASGNIYWRVADGSARSERLTHGALTQNPRSFTPDGKLLLYHQGIDPSSGFDVWGLPLNPIGTPHPILKESYHEYAPSLSPDGRWLAYVSEESGRPEIYVRPFPALNASWKISSDGGLAPVWARDGTELFFQQGPIGALTTSLWSVRISTSAGFRAEAPRLLFRGPYQNAERYGQSYDVAPDGRRFLMVKVEPPPPPGEIQLVLNWFEELKAKVPVRQ